MDTIQLQCGNCTKIMAISREHLGSQVHCPHCRAIVQTPPRESVPAPAPSAPSAPTELFSSPPLRDVKEGESIFGAPEEDANDALFGSEPKPKVEMPADTSEADTPRPVPNPPPTGYGAVPALDEAVPEPAEAEADLTSFKRRPVYDKSMVVPILLIFLIPWSIFWPIVAFYFWNQTRSLSSPALDLLPDTQPTRGGAREVTRIKHDLPLEAKQKTVLGQSLRVGDIEVTPRKVQLNESGDFVLLVDLKNVSKNLMFTPISDRFLEVSQRTAMPYTFLESEKTFDHLYGGFLEWKRGGEEVPWEKAELRPGQQVQAVLTTMEKYRKTVQKLAQAKEPLLWRVQVRRGLVPHNGKSISATTVVGVSFTPSQIEKAPKGKDDA